ncbi:ATP-binding cassette domain-containing protein [Sulfitobacter pacificus]|uniref:ATP-binding cassette domain-containing protein n=1 Tax=Sulfitobacter pacificus TaxID=1499314 RepID=UPI00361B54CC
MISLRNVTLFRPGSRRQSLILEDASLDLPPRARVGILAAPGSGKSTLARMVSGIEEPDFGWITRQGSVSWPLGFAGFLHVYLTVADNMTFVAELCGVPPRHAMVFCENFIGDAFRPNARIEDLAPGERATLAFACSLMREWDFYVVDETISVGDAATRAKCDAILEQRLANAGMLLLSRNARMLGQKTNAHFALIQHKIVPVTDLTLAEQAVTAHRQNTDTKPKQTAEGLLDV